MPEWSGNLGEVQGREQAWKNDTLIFTDTSSPLIQQRPSKGVPTISKPPSVWTLPPPFALISEIRVKLTPFQPKIMCHSVILSKPPLSCGSCLPIRLGFSANHCIRSPHASTVYAFL